MAQQPIEVFFSYSREDKPLRDKLEIHLSSLKRQGVISAWHDRQIVAGSEWEEEIDRHMRTADIILLLISSDFVASKYCYEIELPDAIARHEAGEAYVVPILLRPVAGWKRLPIAKFQVYPSGGIPLTEWNNQDRAFVDVAEGIQAAVDQLLEKRDRERQEQEQREQERIRREQEQEGLRVEEIQRQQLEQARQAEQARLAEQVKVEQGSQTRRAEEARQTVPVIRTQSPENLQPLRTTVPQTVDPKRRQILQWLGFGSGGLALAWMASLASGKGRSPDLKPFSFEVATVNAKGEEAPRQTREAKAFVEDLGNGITLEMVAISGGSFKMGSPTSEKERGSDESPQHPVTVPAFLIGRHEVTQAQYETIVGKNPSNFKGADRPVEKVSWNDAQEFCKKLSQKTRRNYRLPSEAEWEYACRAGTSTPFHFGETVTSNLANYNGTFLYQSEPKGEYRGQTTDGGSFSPNAFGLSDMHGNVWEWCEDTYHENYEGAPMNGSAWNVGGEADTRLVRGGAWVNGPRVCRSANRDRLSFDFLSDRVGFRVVAVT